MKTIDYHYIDKSDWGDGPWTDEPDKRQWIDEATGLPCLVVRSPQGRNLCGYVGVPEGHPYFEKSYGDRVPVKDRNEVYLNIQNAPIAAFLEAANPAHDDQHCRIDCLVDVHGGLTYAAFCRPHKDHPERGICHTVEPGENDRVWWLGFDCAHYGDLSPGYSDDYRDGVYRSFGYVTREVQRLAKQLVSAATGEAR